MEEALPEQEKTEYRGAVVFTPTASGSWELEVGKGVERIKIGYAEEPTREALKLVRQWGATRWMTMIQAFLACPNMTFHESIDDPITEECTSMSSMFQRCSSLRTDKLNAFDVRRVTDMENMLDECGSIGALTNWKLESLSDGTLGLDGCGMTKEHYSATLEAWAANAASQASGVTVKASGLFYNAAGAAARQTLMESKG